jgi:hypothetical protein
VETTDHGQLRGHRKPAAMLPKVHVPYEMLQNLAEKHRVTFILLLARRNVAGPMHLSHTKHQHFRHEQEIRE